MIVLFNSELKSKLPQKKVLGFSMGNIVYVLIAYFTGMMFWVLKR